MWGYAERTGRGRSAYRSQRLIPATEQAANFRVLQQDSRIELDGAWHFEEFAFRKTGTGANPDGTAVEQQGRNEGRRKVGQSEKLQASCVVDDEKASRCAGPQIACGVHQQGVDAGLDAAVNQRHKLTAVGIEELIAKRPASLPIQIVDPWLATAFTDLALLPVVFPPEADK